MVWNPFSKGRRAEPGKRVSDPEPAGDPEAAGDQAGSAKIPIVVSRDRQDAGSGSAVSPAHKTIETSRALGATLVDVPGAHESEGAHASEWARESEGTGAARAPSPGPTAEPSRPADAVQEDVIGVLRTIFDPEIPVNVYELGLVYEINITPPGDVHIRMTLTSPACPVAGSLPPEVETKVASISGVTSVKVELVWDPPWSPDKMSEAARLQLNV